MKTKYDNKLDKMVDCVACGVNLNDKGLEAKRYFIGSTTEVVRVFGSIVSYDSKTKKLTIQELADSLDADVKHDSNDKLGEFIGNIHRVYNSPFFDKNTTIEKLTQRYKEILEILQADDKDNNHNNN